MGVSLFAPDGPAPGARAGAPPPAAEADPEARLRAEERWRAAEILRRCGGDRKRAARLLGLSAQKLCQLLDEPGPA